jgi:hypothetical protein
LKYTVTLAGGLAEEIAHRWGPERTAEGRTSELDFWSGPLAAAILAFTRFDQLRSELLPEIRSFHVVDEVFGPLLFTGLLVDDEVQIVSVTDDPDYWSLIEDDPDD